MPGFWRKCRTTLRWLRFTTWALALAALLTFAWFNLVGLPDFLKTRLVTTLHERGVELEFSRMRLRLIHGFVVENISIGDKKNPGRPALTAGEVQLRLDYSALLHRHLKLGGVVLRNGKFKLPVSPTNALMLLNVQGEVRFLPDDIWSLDELRADFAGAKIRLAGQVAHAPDMANWEMFTGKKTGGYGTLARPLQDFSDTLAKIKFQNPPQVSAMLDGDARDVHSFTLRLNANVPGVTTPWFSARGLQLAASLTAPADAPTNFDASLDFWTNAQPFRLAWTVRTAELHLETLDAGAVECGGVWRAPELAVTKLSAQLGGGKLDTTASLDVATHELVFTNASDFDPHAIQKLLPEEVRAQLAEISWTQIPSLRLHGSLTLPAWTNGAEIWQGNFRSTARLHGELGFTNVIVRGLTVDFARTHFNYANLIWSLPDLELAQGETRLELSGEESESTKNFRCRLHGAIDANTVRPFLTTNNAAHTLGIVQLTEPLVLDVEAAGNLRNLENLTAAGHLALTNFAVRGQTVESFAADIACSNRVLEVLRLQLFRAAGSQTMTADAVALDFNARLIFFTNGFSTFEPMVATRAIGPKTARIIAPYQFLSPPTARVNGQLPLRDINRGHDLDGTDMKFEIIRGAPFRWTKLSVTNITGTVHWLGQELVLTNVATAFYDGFAEGGAYFDFRPVGYDCNFSFEVTARDVDVRLLAADLSSSKTTRLEGILSARVVVTDANSKTWRSWNGYGGAQLRDGLLWNIPVFGFASPVLNTVTPGLGNSRATGASARFVMTNGVVRSDSLEIHTLTMRLQYVGTVDLQQNVDAHVTAQLMRNTPVLGSLVSMVLWPVSKIFECQVNGQVGDPKVTPIYFPFSKFLLSPIRSFEEILPSAEKPKG